MSDVRYFDPKKKKHCGQCGQEYLDYPCGIGHAYQRARILTKERERYEADVRQGAMPAAFGKPPKR